MSYNDHPWVSQMKSVARSYVWWPMLDQHLENMAQLLVKV